MKIKLIIAFLIFQLSFSQDTKMSINQFIRFSDLPVKTSETPNWANQFYDNPEKINVTNLKKDFYDWVIKEQKERKENLDKMTNKVSKQETDKEFENELKEGISEIPIVRFTLHFLRILPSEWVNEAGNLKLPTTNEFLKEVENESKIISKANQKSVLTNNWSQIGPKEVVDGNGDGSSA